MAGVFNGKNTFTQPTRTNDTPTDGESNDFDSPSKDAFDALSAPDFGWSSSGFDREWTYSSFEVSTGHPPFLDGQRIEYGLNEAPGSDLYSLDRRLSPTPRTIGDVCDLLEDDFLFRVTARTDTQSSFSCVLRGPETNLAEIQVAGDVLRPPSAVLEEGWSCSSTPTLSVTSEISDETSLPDPPTPSEASSVAGVPATIVTASGSLTPPPPTEAPATRESSLPKGSRTPEPQVALDVYPPVASARKRKRDSPEVDDSQSGSPEAASDTETSKWFSIEGRGKPRHGSAAEATIFTKYGESCCSRVGDAGYCQFEWHRNGRSEKCGIELISDREVLTAHFALHFENLGFYATVANNPQWRPCCPWCHKEATTFDNFLRHVNYSELELNATCRDFGASINRDNQSRFRARHEETQKHQEWLMRTRENLAPGSEDEPSEQKLELVEGSSSGTKRRRSNAKVVQVTEDEEDEECDEFIEGSSSDATRRRSEARRTRASAKEEPDEREELFVEDTTASWKRRRAKRTKTTSKEDSDEEEEFVQGSSTGTKRRRLR